MYKLEGCIFEMGARVMGMRIILLKKGHFAPKLNKINNLGIRCV